MPLLKSGLPYAQNDSTTVDLFQRRSLYRDKVFVKDTGVVQEAVTDLWYRRSLYGKTDHRGNIVLPKERGLNALQTDDGTTFYAMRFIAEAYNDLAIAIKNQAAFGNTQFVGSPYGTLEITKAWSSAYRQYFQHMGRVYSALVVFLSSKEANTKIKTFDDFVRYFFKFYDLMDARAMPLTLSGFVTSRLCSSLTSGLMIERGSALYSDDKIKYDVYANSPYFETYQYLASNHGFMIDKNIPWRLIANLNSCYLRGKMRKGEVYYNPSSDYFMDIHPPVDATPVDAAKMDNFFDIYYVKTYEEDIRYLKYYIYQMWNQYIERNPYYEEYYHKKGGCPDTKALKTKKRRKSLDTQPDHMYTIKDFWLQRYFMLRIAETQAAFSASEVNYILFNAKKILDIYGPSRSFKFLNAKLKKRHKHIYDEWIAPATPRSACVAPDVKPLDIQPGPPLDDKFNKCL